MALRLLADAWRGLSKEIRRCGEDQDQGTEPAREYMTRSLHWGFVYNPKRVRRKAALCSLRSLLCRRFYGLSHPNGITGVGRELLLQMHNLMIGGKKAAEDCRTPKPGGNSRQLRFREASWSATVLCRFSSCNLLTGTCDRTPRPQLQKLSRDYTISMTRADVDNAKAGPSSWDYDATRMRQICTSERNNVHTNLQLYGFGIAQARSKPSSSARRRRTPARL